MHNEGSKTGKHVHFVDGVPALQMDILNQRYLSSSYAKLQFKPQPPLADNHPEGQEVLFLIADMGRRVSPLCANSGHQ